MKTTNKLQTIKSMGIIAIMLISLPVFANANAIVKGHVISDHNEPLEYATATLICPETMKIAEGDMCNNEGEFIIENVEPGEYILSVRKVGFEKDETKRILVTNTNEIHEIPKVVLNESNVMLCELEVVAKPAKKDVVENL
ncbi:MAG TPA: carboxypeptidase-like regulatory domain-containing protein [Paludibacter sp.]|nr:carboxypeptidase-like regulatory domain-containing protein [Paludibacter sp.]